MGPGFTYSNERDLFGTIRGEFDITDKVMAWAALGGRSSDESSFTTTPEVINQAGDMTMRSEEHTSELQSLMRISYAVFCLKKKNKHNITNIASKEIQQQ